MKEDGKEGNDDLEKAKRIMGRIDPALLSAALWEMTIEAEEAEEADVAKVKEAIKGIYDSIPEGKDKKSIISKAVVEFASDIIESEVKAIKKDLASFDRETLQKAARDYIVLEGGVPAICIICVYSDVLTIPCVPGCLICVSCMSCVVCVSCMSCVSCIGSHICPQFVCTPSNVCPQSLCNTFSISGNPLFSLPVPSSMAKEQLKEEIIQDLLQRPELSRAMKRMLKKIQDEK